MTHRIRSAVTVFGVLACLGLATAAPAMAKAPGDINTTYQCVQAPCPGTPAP